MGLMQLHGVSPGGCATRFTPEARSPFRDFLLVYEALLALRPSTLPVKTQQTEANSKVLKPLPCLY